MLNLNMYDNKERLQEAVNAELSAMEIPESLSPEQMTARLKEQKRKGIRISKKAGFRAVAALCACLILVVGIAPVLTKRDSVSPLTTKNCYMENAGSYHKLYEQMQHLAAENKKANKSTLLRVRQSKDFSLSPVQSATIADEFTGLATNDYELAIAKAPETLTETSNSRDISETLTQVEGISESDIVKCDGDALYILRDTELRYLPIHNGDFGTIQTLTAQCDVSNLCAENMYLVDGNAIVVYSGYDGERDYMMCCVITYTHGEDGTLVQNGICYQEGVLVDTRVVDSTLYLVTNAGKSVTEDIIEKELDTYVPCCGESTESFVEADDILIPDSWDNCFNQVQYELVSAIDTRSAELRDSKALAGAGGKVYMTKNAIYLSSFAKNGKTRISRIAYSDGQITPSATALISGNPINQYAMHETESAFFIATTGRDTIMSEDGLVASAGNIKNYLYSFDLSMQQLDCIEYAERESIKAVNFVDQYAYVVTFLQTDPLFCIDCSNPDKLSILDEFKVSGYSTFLYPWNNHLLSFGIESGDRNGIKLMMYDTDKNGKLTMLDDHVWALDLNDDWWWEDVDSASPSYTRYFSQAVYDYKALYLQPEKNLIAIPLFADQSDAGQESYQQYVFLQFNEETNQFEELGTVNLQREQSQFARCVSVDHTFYLIVDQRIVSVDGDSFQTLHSIHY